MATLPLSPAGPQARGAQPAQPGRGANPLDLASRRVNWLDRRQAVLAQNIANADTPNYRPHDMVPFARHLAAATTPGLARTASTHLQPIRSAHGQAPEDRRVDEVAPDGNAVSLDREAVRMAETDTAHALAMAVHRSFMGMFRLALGRQG
ncbi:MULTISPECIES: flagellar basal body rod protein FlgB [Roseomonadaceae]|uniref:Flagellar biosynthesis protein FlgB n=1 Tax=Falsiroseomonas oleicola TaxID=2801474 RepID=A0ABS6H9F4_9PROT|nr:flagellar basal body protein [Roseomonas oleicola]MBU8545001.1 flagellar biosynthesis protein FlgB [Roseomonas oleicola]